ncbi:MAG: NifU family protein [Dethiobacteria bacterium]
MKEQVERAINLIRPALQADGGNVELIDVDEKSGIVKVKLTGACGGCPMAAITLKNGIERVVKKEVPQVTEVVSV